MKYKGKRKYSVTLSQTIEFMFKKWNNSWEYIRKQKFNKDITHLSENTSSSKKIKERTIFLKTKQKKVKNNFWTPTVIGKKWRYI